MADQRGGGGGGGSGGGGNNVMMRDYRKGNWNVTETMTLIEAKKMDDERRTKRSEEGGEGAGRGGPKPSEPRWKWVEDYCWRKGCFRSQNQCNDKWDNLMRDYKKVREYERRRTGEEGEEAAAAASYWKIEKSERKERNLPTNMMPHIYEALVDVVERRAGGGAGAGAGAGAGGSQRAAAASASVAAYSIGHPGPDVIVSTGYVVETPIQPPLPQQQHVLPGAFVPALPPPSQKPEAPPQQLPPAAAATSQPCPTQESEPSEHSDAPAKRRRRGGDPGGGAASEDPHEPGGGGGGGDIGAAISRSASIIAEALRACDEREERRHRDLVGLHERRLKLEESKTEISRQGFDGLVSAINKLANSIHALASSSKNQSSSS